MNPDGTTVRGDLRERREPRRKVHGTELVLLLEHPDPIDKEKDPGLLRRVGEPAVLADRPGIHPGVPHGAVIDDVAQHPYRAHDPLLIVPGNDRPDVWKIREHAQPARAEVKPVNMSGPAVPRRRGRRHRDGAQSRALARAARAVDRQVPVTVGLVEHRRLRLGRRLIEHPERKSLVSAGVREPAETVDRRELVEPRLTRRRHTGIRCRRAHRCDDPGDVGGAGVAVVPGVELRRLPHGVTGEVEFRDVDAGPRGLPRRAAAHVAGLEGRQPAGAALGGTAPRDRRIEIRGHLVAEDVHRVIGVGHPQRDPQVRVGPQVVFDHACRPLRRQHEVQTE